MREMPEMMILPYDGKFFFVANNTTRPEKTEGGVEKRKVNEIVAGDREWDFVLDCYAGFGISTSIFAKHAKKVVALEEDFRYASAMWVNLYQYYQANEIGYVEILNDDNRYYLNPGPEKNQHPPSLIDLDPVGSCKKQLELALEWMKDGALLMTNGHIGYVARNMDWVHNVYPHMGNRYIGDKAVDWPEEYYIPWLQRNYPQLRRIVHFYAHPTSVRCVCEVGEFKFFEKTIQKLVKRPKYLGKYKDMKKNEEKNGKRVNKS